MFSEALDDVHKCRFSSFATLWGLCSFRWITDSQIDVLGNVRKRCIFLLSLSFLRTLYYMYISHGSQKTPPCRCVSHHKPLNNALVIHLETWKEKNAKLVWCGKVFFIPSLVFPTCSPLGFYPRCNYPVCQPNTQVRAATMCRWYGPERKPSILPRYDSMQRCQGHVIHLQLELHLLACSCASLRREVVYTRQRSAVQRKMLCSNYIN